MRLETGENCMWEVFVLQGDVYYELVCDLNGSNLFIVECFIIQIIACLTDGLQNKLLVW